MRAREINQERRSKGEEYTTTKGKKMQGAKQPSPELKCKCRLKCSTLSHRHRLILFEQYRSIDRKAQRAYLDNLVDVIPVQRATTSQPSRRQVTTIYQLQDEEGRSVSVCKSTFRDTFGLGRGELDVLRDKSKHKRLGRQDDEIAQFPKRSRFSSEHDNTNREGLSEYQLRDANPLKDDNLSNDPSEFSPLLKAKIQSENLRLENIYNADESRILWRLLMACTFPLHLEEEEEAPLRKGNKDHITALFCANASGSHQIPLLIIGRSRTPNSLIHHIPKNLKDLRLKNLEKLGVIYTYQACACMDRCIFMLWYKDEFIPRVLARQRKDGITGKVVLLLDNALSHPHLNELNAINENFEVLYLPTNGTALIQPMEQGLIATTKKLFKRDLLRGLLLSERPKGAVAFLKELNLPDCFVTLSLAWDALKLSSLKKAWKPLLGDLIFRQSFPRQETINIKQEEEEEEEEEDPLSIDYGVETEFQTDSISFPHEIFDQVSELLSGPDYSVQESREFLLKWFENDENDKICDWESSSGRREPATAPKIPKSKTVFENSEMTNFVTCGRLESEIEIKMENSETMFENSDIVNDIADGSSEPEIEIKIENSETMFESAETMEIMPSEIEPKIMTKVENSETLFENYEPVKISSSEAFDHLMKLKDWVKSEADCLPKHLDCIRVLENFIKKA